jgi:C4-dicarboxylate-specific signal transduction histidine kinase
MRNTVLRLSSAALALAVFLVDVATPLEGAIAVLYVVAILLAARTFRRADIVVAAASCVALTITAYLVSHDLHSLASPALRALVSLAAIAITTLLALQNRAATNHLAESERRYRRMFEATRIGVVEEDWTEIRAALRSLNVSSVELNDHPARNPDFVRQARPLAKITNVNPALQKMVGAASSSDFVESVDKLLGESDRTFAGALVAFAGGEPFYEGETELVGLQGRRVPVLFTITFPAGDDRNVLAFVVDITERKQSQDALLVAQAELAHAARVATLGELTASIAHEVNQPLMAIVTSGEAGLRWLRRDVPNLEEVAAAISRAVAEGRRASEIVSRIRAFLKKRPAQLDRLQIGEIIEEAALLVDHELSKDDIILAIETEAELPPIRGDRVQIQQVLVNLIVNAGQAMSKQAGPRIVVVRAGLAAAGSLSITVKDTGPGIAQQDLPRLFEPFFSTKHGGMGMGLAICRTTVEAHGGQLSAESTPGSGATFRLTLPTIQEHGSL